MFKVQVYSDVTPPPPPKKKKMLRHGWINQVLNSIVLCGAGGEGSILSIFTGNGPKGWKMGKISNLFVQD